MCGCVGFFYTKYLLFLLDVAIVFSKKQGAAAGSLPSLARVIALQVGQLPFVQSITLLLVLVKGLSS